MMQAKRRDRAYPNYSGKDASPREDTEFLDRVKFTNVKEEYGISARIWIANRIVEFLSCLAGLKAGRADRFADTHAAQTATQ